MAAVYIYLTKSLIPLFFPTPPGLEGLALIQIQLRSCTVAFHTSRQHK